MVSRRTFLAGSGLALAATLGQGASAFAQDDLAMLDPLGSLDNYAKLKPLLFDYDRCKGLVSRLWDAYGKNRSLQHGEWTAIYTYCWWRTAPNRAERIKVAKVGQKVAAKLAEDFPDSPVGHQWLAIHMGLEILSVGVVDALHAVPSLRKSLERAMAIDANYFYGLPTLILAKVYAKLPQFPVSIGDLDHALALLERIRPLQEKTFAIWYLFLAETIYLKSGAEPALKVLDRIADNVVPKDSATAYLKESTLNDARILRAKLATGSYERYLWDPLLEVAQPG